MTIKATPVIKDGCLMVRGKVVLTRVPQNILVSPASNDSAFFGATDPTPSSRHVFKLGVLEKYRFLCLFRFKIWWMIPRVGKSGSEIPMETQMLLLEATEESALNDEVNSSEASTNNTFYILFLPVLDGLFRTSLQGTSANELHFCVESGDASVQTSQALEAVFVNSGENPFELIKNSVKILEQHKGTFCHIENKKIPVHLDWFGWCTWDAFYTQVDPTGNQRGSSEFLRSKEGEPPIEGIQFATRLVDIRENTKFRSSGPDEECTSLHEFIDTIKEKYGLKFVYVWHALAGYWGGVLPTSDSMKKYNPKLVYPIQSPGNLGNMRDIVMVILEKYGVGFIDPSKIFDFYNDLHSYLASNGVDGVKVDVQNLIETLGSGNGGRVMLTGQYQEALEKSVSRNFKENNLICSMSHNSDSIYSSKRSAVARASEDFMPREPTFQTLHIASVAFNSLLLGEIFVPDWDMFQSTHFTAEFHGAARALGGCAVYVSDKPGVHDFKILKRLVLPDGSILRARHAGRPTRDCLFVDPVMDAKSLLKIWNLNKLTGVIGVFNCQGEGRWPMEQEAEEIALAVPSGPSSLSGHVSPIDVEFLDEIAGEDWNGNCAVYGFNSGSLSMLPKKGVLEVSLTTLKYEIYTICPIKVFGQNLHFSPIGLLDMYNSGGAVEAVNCVIDVSSCTIKVNGRGCGRFGAYSSTKPTLCRVDMEEEEFTYSDQNGLLTVKLEGMGNLREIEFIY
ncbi:hypothetical protein OIU74_016893 [Salix koriyanagi]|uniref:Galactinol--sucrose galactosyltransferase n=1 Tax=Salix koriyanagi TaxID=2511006 RepID=A0A9Q0PHK8_9ROSI|nr:hypothetical protein OIU74_016893 [Salix koriyanagi]